MWCPWDPRGYVVLDISLHDGVSYGKLVLSEEPE